jgi:hypothetical protein
MLAIPADHAVVAGIGAACTSPAADCSSVAVLTLTALTVETVPAMASAARTTPRSTDLGLLISIDGPPIFTQAMPASRTLGCIRLLEE